MKTPAILKRRSKIFLAALTILISLVLISICAPLMTQQSIDVQNVSERLMSPSASHWFGTDVLGRDNFIRTMVGLKLSLFLALVSTVVSLIAGISYGSISGFIGGKTDQVLMRLLDIFYSIPTLLIAIIIMVYMGSGNLSVIIALSSLGWIHHARLVRAQVMSAKELQHVEAAVAYGASSFQLILKHILPMTLGPVIVSVFFQIPSIVLSESFLSFLGIGVQPPEVSLGVLIADGFRGLRSYPHLILYPGFIFFLLLLSFQFIGDGIRDYFDPKAQRNIDA